MRKLFTIIAICATVVSANAQSSVKGNKFGDNWTLGISGGVITPARHYAIIKSARPTATLELTKWFTPYFGLAAQGQAGINLDKAFDSKTAIDMSQVLLLNKFNLMNMFGGYKGEPRMFEIEAYGGIGYTHFYNNGYKDNGLDALSSKAGLNFNFNLGAAKAWQINLKPAITWLLDGNCKNAYYSAESRAYESAALHPLRYDLNRAALEFTAGVTYKFGTSNGTHNFVNVKEYDQAEVDGLNAKINDLRSQADGLNSEINSLKSKNAQLESDLNACQNKKVAPATIVSNKDLESYVSFAQGKSVVERSQMPNVERVATYMKNHKDTKVAIKGYASPEGSKAINDKLSKARAEAVKTILVKKYKIDANRIEAAGEGVGNLFKEPDWNRVSICTLDK